MKIQEAPESTAQEKFADHAQVTKALKSDLCSATAGAEKKKCEKTVDDAVAVAFPKGMTTADLSDIAPLAMVRKPGLNWTYTIKDTTKLAASTSVMELKANGDISVQICSLSDETKETLIGVTVSYQERSASQTIWTYTENTPKGCEGTELSAEDVKEGVDALQQLYQQEQPSRNSMPKSL